MKVLVFDICTSVNGHRIPYAGLVAKAFTEHEVVVALPDQVADEPILNDYFSDQVQFQFCETERQSTALADVRTSWRCLVQQLDCGLCRFSRTKLGWTDCFLTLSRCL